MASRDPEPPEHITISVAWTQPRVDETSGELVSDGKLHPVNMYPGRVDRDPHSDRLCLLCLRPGEYQCSECRQAWYCADDCEELDRSSHEKVCNAFVSMTPASRPTPAHRLVLYFPIHKAKPQLVWAEHKTTIDQGWLREELIFNHDTMADDFAETGLVGDVRWGFKRIDCSRPLRERNDVGHALIMLTHDARLGRSMPNPSIVNQSISRLAKGCLYPCLGPFIIVPVSYGGPHVQEPRLGIAREPFQVHDVTPRDVRHAEDYFVGRRINHCVPKEAIATDRVTNRNLQAVRISDPTEPFNLATGVDRFKEVFVPVSRAFHPRGPGRSIYDRPTRRIAMAFALGLNWWIRGADNDISVAGQESDTSRRPEWYKTELHFLNHIVMAKKVIVLNRVVPENGGATNQPEAQTDAQRIGFLIKPKPIAFKNSVVIMHGKGAWLTLDHVQRLQVYLMLCLAQRVTPSQEGFEESWTNRTVGPTLQSPYDLERMTEADPQRLGGEFREHNHRIMRVCESELPGFWTQTCHEINHPPSDIVGPGRSRLRRRRPPVVRLQDETA